MRKGLSIVLSLILIIGLICPCSVLAISVDSEPKLVEDAAFVIDGQENIVIHDQNGNELSKSAKKPSAVAKAAAALPSSYDSRSRGCVTSVKNQGDYGTCWAHAAIASMESQLITDYGLSSSLNLSEDHLVWFSDKMEPTLGDGVTSATLSNYPYSGGNWYRTTNTLANWWGIEKEANAAYPTGNYAESKRKNASYRLQQATLIAEKHDDLLRNIKEIKQAVMDNGVVEVSYYNDNSYFSSGNKTYYMSNSAYKDKHNHSVAIVGWDDTFSRTNFRYTAPQNGAFLIKNSWGTSWGSSGYFWISYYDYSLSSAVSYECVPVSGSDYDHVYSYNGHNSLWFSHYESKTSLQYANAFVSPRAEILNAVGLWIMQDDIDYTIQIYRGLTSSNGKPTSGTLVTSATTSGNAAHEGYYTIPLKSSVALRANERYSVVVSITAKSHSFIMIPFEIYGGTKDYGDGLIKTYRFSSNRGESYICPGSKWYDVKDYTSYEFNNAKLNVYTKNDTVRPGASISSTSDTAASQTVTLSLSDNAELEGYYWGTSSSYSLNGYTSISGTSNSVTRTVSTPGTYYLTARDFAGNLSTTVSKRFYEIAFNTGGGSVSPARVIAASGSSFELPTSTRPGYRFDGWYTNAALTQAAGAAGANYTTRGNATLYAKWTLKEITAVTPAPALSLRYKKGTGSAKPTLTPADALYTAEYESSNTDVATVDQNGNVRAGKQGTATITCTVMDMNGNVVKTCTTNVTVAKNVIDWFITILLFGWLWY